MDGRVVVVVTGGVAAFKSLEVVRELLERGYEVETVQTEAARQFLGAQSLASIAHANPFESLFGSSPSPHTELAHWADLLVVVPASADFLAKMAHGIADDLASALVLAFAGPVVVAPAMHSAMWEAPATRRNVDLLAADGVHFVGPTQGRLAGGDQGVGRLVDPTWIVEAVGYWLVPTSRSLTGLSITVSVGGTREPIDAVRYLGNRSSGRQGYAIARAAAIAGAKVRCVATVEPPFPADLIDVVRVETAVELLDAMLEAQIDSDVLIMSAAVADFRVAAPFFGKVKREGTERLDLSLVANPDVLVELVEHRREGQLIVGFAAEVEALEESVAKKLAKKGVDLMVGNNVATPGTGFGSPENAVYLLDRTGWESHVPLSSKTEVARAILAAIATLAGV